MSVKWKLTERKSWGVLLSQPENFLRELNKPYSFGNLWTFVYRKNFEAILEMIGDVRSRMVLDIGCGSGWLCEWLADEGVTPVGVDVSLEFCKISKLRARQRGFNANFVCADGEHLPFKGNTFNIAIAYQSLHHLPHPDKAIGEALRVSESLVLGDEPAKLPLSELALRILKMVVLARVHTGEFSGMKGTRFDPEDLWLTYQKKGYDVRFRREWSFVPAIFLRVEKLKIVRDIYRIAYSFLMNVKLLRNFGHGFTMEIRRTSLPEVCKGRPSSLEGSQMVLGLKDACKIHNNKFCNCNCGR